MKKSKSFQRMMGVSIWMSMVLLLITCLVHIGYAATRVDYAVTASGNDAFEPTYTYTASSSLIGWQGTNSSNRTNRYAYFRWAVNIPDGARITYATISVRALNPGTTGSPDLDMFLIDSDNCPSFQTNPSSLATNGTVLTWSPSNFTQGTWYSVGNITTLVQLYINRAGYTSGNYMGIKLGGGDGSRNSSKYRVIRQYDYDGNSVNSSAKLVVVYNRAPNEVTLLSPASGGVCHRSHSHIYMFFGIRPRWGSCPISISSR